MTVLSKVETGFKAIETGLTADIGTVLTTDVTPLLTKKVDVFGASIPVNKKVTKKLAELVAIAALAVGLIGTQVYVYVDHKKSIDLNTARIGSSEAFNKQVDTNFVNVDAAITATNKIISSVQTDQKATDAKVDALEKEINTRATPVRTTYRKTYRKRK